MEGNVVLTSKKTVSNKQVIVDCRFLISSGNEVGKVISIHAIPFITSTDIYASKIKYSGKVNFKLIYLTEDGRVLSINNMSDFDETIDMDGIDEDCYSDISFKVVDVTTPSVKANEVKVACVMETLVDIDESEMCESIDLEEGIFCKNNENACLERCGCFKESFELEEELRINDDLNNVLSLDSELCIKDVYAGNGFAVVSGQIFFVVTYDTEDSPVKCYKTCIEFKQEIGMDDVGMDSVVKASMYIQQNLIKMSVVQEEGYNSIGLEIPIIATGCVYNKKNINIIEDVYSPKNILRTTHREINAVEHLHCSSFEDYLREMVTIDMDNSARLIGFSGANVVISTSYITHDKLTVEGVVSGTILLMTEEGLSSVITEVPFEVNNVRGEYIGLEDLSVRVGIGDFDASIKNAGELEINAKLNFFITATKHKTMYTISQIDIESERPKRDCAIEIVLTGEHNSFWDLGKSLGVSTEQLLLQNPHLTEPITAGEKIVIYYPAISR